MRRLTHASFFSGVGGTDLGLERAGFRTVSFSEVEPYACAVLAERWPDVPNLGDITAISDRPAECDAARRAQRRSHAVDGPAACGQSADCRHDGAICGRDWQRADLWSGGFPCQDLSVAGKRLGFDGERSVLAFAFLNLVERYRPRAVVLENVEGLLSSHHGRDMAALCGRLVELGYGVAYRLLDAQFFAVPQRRRRVFVVGLRVDAADADCRLAAERAAEILSVGTLCARHSGTSRQASARHDRAASGRSDVANALTGRYGKGINSNLTDPLVVVDRAPSDADGVRKADGLARWAHDRDVVAFAQNQREEIREVSVAGALDAAPGTHQQTYVAFVKSARAQTSTDGESWIEGDVMPTLNAFDVGDVRTTAVVVSSLTQGLGTGGPDFAHAAAGWLVPSEQGAEDDGLPVGLDGHRYRVCGNGVVAPVAEWIGRRLYDALATTPEREPASASAEDTHHGSLSAAATAIAPDESQQSG